MQLAGTVADSAAAGCAVSRVELSVPDMHCGGCMRRVEDALTRLDEVAVARVNLTRRSVRIDGKPDLSAAGCIEALRREGFASHVMASGAHRRGASATNDSTGLLRALAVAGFAAGNVMMLSVSVWSGAEGSWRTLFHLLSAAIALPALAYAGRIFFTSAWRSIRHGAVNMDVPISIGLLLTVALSLHDTLTHGEQIYFDAALMLVFFLLAGRVLENQVRERARRAADALARLQPEHALVIDDDDVIVERPVASLKAGTRLHVESNARLPVDAEIRSARASLDCSHASGESLPAELAAGDLVLAGSLNVGEPFTAVARGTVADSFLSEVDRLMQAAGGRRGTYRRIADRAASLYAPVVHLAAALSLLGWYLATGDLHRALTVAVAVLIITCPCALGLAVPIVQVVATRRLFDHGVLMRDGAALERLGSIDTVVFDKTGTLSEGTAALIDAERHDAGHLALAAALAAGSPHPYARALLRAAERHGITPAQLDETEVSDVPGFGREAWIGGKPLRLGRLDWATPVSSSATRTSPCSCLSRDGVVLAEYHYADTLRDDAQRCIDALSDQSLDISVLSGDDDQAVQRASIALGIADARSRTLPADKVARINQLSDGGRQVLMIGDGANDSPAMTAASVSMAPGSAADAGREAADFILLHDRLCAIPLAVSIARRASRLVRLNIGLALAYNVCALPLAIAGLVTPLIAAVSMSLSSIIVIVNALRLSRRSRLEEDIAA